MNPNRKGAAPRPTSALPKLLAPSTPAAFVGIAAAVVNAALRVAIIPVFVAPVFDQVLGRNDLTALPKIVGIAAVVAVGGALALWAQDALLGRAAAEVTATWRRELYASLLQRTPGALPGTSGGLASRILTDLREIETYFRFGLGTLVAESATVLAIVVYLTTTNARAAALLLVSGIPVLLVLRWMGHRLERIATRSQQSTEDLGRHLQEGFRHHETVRAFAADTLMLDRFEPANRRTAREMASRSLLAGVQTPVTQLLLFAAVGLLIAVLATSVGRGSMSAGQVVSFVTLVALLATPAQLLPKGYAMAREASAAARRLRELAGPDMARPNRSQDDVNEVVEPGAQERPDDGTDGLLLETVSFAYEPQRPVLRELDLRLPRRGLVAIVGLSGSGKTTLLRLLLGFLEPSSGGVRLGGRLLSDLGESLLRQRVSYVPQDHEVLSGKVRDSLSMGRSVPDEALWRALRDVGLADAVFALPGRLDHELAEDGTGLSGGQRQRLAVARAVLTRPDVLLLDEPTSSLDGAGEAELVRLLEGLARERLVIAVAHRPALAQAADQVLELHDGRLRRRSVPGTPSGSV